MQVIKIYIIDFLENVLYPSDPSLVKQEEEALRLVKQRCRKNRDKSLNRLVEEVVVRQEKYQLIARGDEDNTFVALLSKERARKEQHAEIVDKIVAFIEHKDIEKLGRGELKRFVEQVVAREETEVLSKSIHEKVAEGESMVQSMIKSAKQDALKSKQLLVNLEQTKQETSKLAQGSREAKLRTFWINYKLYVFIFGLLAVLVVIVLLLAIHMFRK